IRSGNDLIELPKLSSDAAAVFAIFFVPTAITSPGLLPSSLCPNLAGAEGFEPPSSVLETDSLTVELTPLCSCSAGALARVPLFHFFVRRVLTASGAKFLLLDPVRCRLAVLHRRIVPLFAVATLQRNDLSG